MTQQLENLSGAPGIQTIAIIETLRETRATSILIALALARPHSYRVLICHWHTLEFSPSTVFVRGAFYQVTDDLRFETHTLNEVRPVDALFFYGPNSGTLEPQDAPVLQKLFAAGIDSYGVPLYEVVDRLMLAASLRGVVTNALGTSRAWGPKHNQELKLRRYEKATRRTVIRPETYIARPHELRMVLSIFARRSETCLLKPVYGEGGRGLRIVRPGVSVSRLNHTVVVQRLIPNPLLVDGHKADLRCYLLIDVDDRQSSKRLRPIFIRRALAPYVPESETAEITNTSYRARRGHPPDMRLLAPMPSISPQLYDEITSQLDSLADCLLDAYFLDRDHQQAGSNVVAKRLILWGVDALIALYANSEPRVYFLEVNPFPAFFRGVPACDDAMEEMFLTEYLPALTRSGQF